MGSRGCHTAAPAAPWYMFTTLVHRVLLLDSDGSAAASTYMANSRCFLVPTIVSALHHCNPVCLPNHPAGLPAHDAEHQAACGMNHQAAAAAVADSLAVYTLEPRHLGAQVYTLEQQHHALQLAPTQPYSPNISNLPSTGGSTQRTSGAVVPSAN